jgi:hypothetical protein
MDPGTVRRGEIIAGLSGLALLIIMFLTWWSLDTAGTNVGAAEALGVEIDTTLNAWQAADFVDFIWFITALTAIALGLAAGLRTNVSLPVALSPVVTGLALLSLVLIVIRIIDPPFELGRSYGVWLGLLATVGILYGAWETMQEEGGDASAGRTRR